MADPQHEHQPVLVSSVLRLADSRPGQIVLDGTVGLGGHALALLPRIMPGGRYVGMDIDAAMLQVATDRLAGFAGPSLVLERASYADFPQVLERHGLSRVDLMLLDLGVNSAQIEDAPRGFSFESDGPLDMRFDRSQKLAAVELVNGLSERELSDLLYEFGQEGLSRKIARRICEVRRDSRITTTRALAQAVQSAYTAAGETGGRIHPATRVFMALRMTVNREIENLKTFLAKAFDWLAPGGKLAVIAFHSVEDAVVKRHMLAEKAAGRMRVLTKSPVVAEADELRNNPRSRSAKLRVSQRVE